MNKSSIDDFTSGRTPAGRGDLPSLPQRPGGIRVKKKTRKLAVSVSPQKLGRRCVVKMMTSIIRERQALGAGRPRCPAAMICSAAMCDELDLFLVRPTSMRPGSSAAAPTQLGESAWCDVMHVLHSFIRPRSIQDVHFASTAAMGLPSLPRRPRLLSPSNCCETCLGGLDRSAYSSSPANLLSLLESLLESGSRSTPTPTPPHSTPPSSSPLFLGLLCPGSVVIGCHQAPGDKLAARVRSPTRPQSLRVVKAVPARRSPLET